jgi:transketolase
MFSIEFKQRHCECKGVRITDHQLDRLSVNTYRFLSVGAEQKANSGHPGLPLGAVPMGYVLWTRFLQYNPANLQWFNGHRLVLSAGHGPGPTARTDPGP